MPLTLFDVQWKKKCGQLRKSVSTLPPVDDDSSLFFQRAAAGWQRLEATSVGVDSAQKRALLTDRVRRTEIIVSRPCICHLIVSFPVCFVVVQVLFFVEVLTVKNENLAG